MLSPLSLSPAKCQESNYGCPGGLQHGISDHPGDCAQLLVAQARLWEDGRVGRKGQAESWPAFDADVQVPRCPWQKQSQTQSPGHPGKDFFPLCMWFSTTKKLMSNISSQGPWLLRDSRLPDSRNCQIINYSFHTLNTSQWYTCQPGSPVAAITL